jgi:hypothetical protein
MQSHLPLQSFEGHLHADHRPVFYFLISARLALVMLAVVPLLAIVAVIFGEKNPQDGTQDARSIGR